MPLRKKLSYVCLLAWCCSLGMHTSIVRMPELTLFFGETLSAIKTKSGSGPAVRGRVFWALRAGWQMAAPASVLCHWPCMWLARGGIGLHVPCFYLLFAVSVEPGTRSTEPARLLDWEGLAAGRWKPCACGKAPPGDCLLLS
jgi:hypothetical protein